MKVSGGRDWRQKEEIIAIKNTDWNHNHKDAFLILSQRMVNLSCGLKCLQQTEGWSMEPRDQWKISKSQIISMRFKCWRSNVGQIIGRGGFRRRERSREEEATIERGPKEKLRLQRIWLGCLRQDNQEWANKLVSLVTVTNRKLKGFVTVKLGGEASTVLTAFN